MRSMAPDWGDDRGFVGGSEALPFSILVFVIGALLVANTWAVVDADLTVDLAAREAGRVLVESDVHDPAELRAVSAVVATDLGLDPERLHLTVGGPAPGEALTRCERVTVDASYVVEAIALPGRISPDIEVHSRHSEVVDPHRSSTQLQEGSCRR